MAASTSVSTRCGICSRAGSTNGDQLMTCNTCVGTPTYCRFHMEQSHIYHPTTQVHQYQSSSTSAAVAAAAVSSSAPSSTSLVAEDPLSNIRRTTASVMSASTEHVTIDNERLISELKDHPELYREKALPSWCHYHPSLIHNTLHHCNDCLIS
jgi:hypothetical protein